MKKQCEIDVNQVFPTDRALQASKSTQIFLKLVKLDKNLSYDVQDGTKIQEKRSKCSLRTPFHYDAV
jgi:hypothetical protein